jgi:hypothetical protein
MTVVVLTSMKKNLYHHHQYRKSEPANCSCSHFVQGSTNSTSTTSTTSTDNPNAQATTTIMIEAHWESPPPSIPTTTTRRRSASSLECNTMDAFLDLSSSLHGCSVSSTPPSELSSFSSFDTIFEETEKQVSNKENKRAAYLPYLKAVCIGLYCSHWCLIAFCSRA